jgi:beta-glucanase (GH16 family)
MKRTRRGAARRIVLWACLVAAAALLSPACLVTIPDVVVASACGAAPNGDSPWVPAGYSQVFGDEFDEPALDTSKWWTRFVTNGGTLNTLPSNGEHEFYGEQDNHVMTGSSLELTAYHVSDTDPQGLYYRSGMIRSKTLMRYGYLEARVRVPAARGVWPAFWLFPENGASPPLVVVFSFVDNGTTDKGNTLHTEAQTDTSDTQGGAFLYTDPHFDESVTSWTASFNFPDCFHVVGLLWDETSLTVYVDGQMIVKRAYKWVIMGGATADRAHLLLNLAIGGHSGTFIADPMGIDSAQFPQAFEVDYVRVYQKNVDVGTSQIGQDLCPGDGGC